MKQSSSKESNSFSGTREVLPLIWNTEVHHHNHNSASFVPNMGHTNPVQGLSSYLYKIHFNILLPSMLRLPESAGTTSRNMQWTGTPLRGSGPMFLNLLVLLRVQARSQLCETHVEIDMSVFLYE